jgi:hypothetical protein
MAKQRRRRGHIQLRSNGTFRVHVYTGLDPITKKPRYLNETVRTFRPTSYGGKSQPALLHAS